MQANDADYLKAIKHLVKYNSCEIEQLLDMAMRYVPQTNQSEFENIRDRISSLMERADHNNNNRLDLTEIENEMEILDAFLKANAGAILIGQANYEPDPNNKQPGFSNICGTCSFMSVTF